MAEEQKYEVHPQIAAAMAPEPIQEQPIQQEAKPQEVVEQSVQEQKIGNEETAKSWRDLRDAKRRAEQERDEVVRRLQEIESRAASSQSDEDIQLKPDDLVEWRHVEKKIQKLEQRIEQSQNQTTQATAETRLKAQYPDFDKVVNQDTIQSLRESYPEIAESLNASPDLYKKAVSAYTLIKKLGLYAEDTYEPDRIAAQKNAAKPRPLTSIAPQQGESPLSRANAFANGLTDDLKAQLRKEMEEARRGY